MPFLRAQLTPQQRQMTSPKQQRMDTPPLQRMRHNVWWVEPVRNLSQNQWEKMWLQIWSMDSVDSKMQQDGKWISNCSKKRNAKKTKAMDMFPTTHKKKHKNKNNNHTTPESHTNQDHSVSPWSRWKNWKIPPATWRGTDPTSTWSC